MPSIIPDFVFYPAGLSAMAPLPFVLITRIIRGAGDTIMTEFLKKLHIDAFLFCLVGTVAAATFFPCEGTAKAFFHSLTAFAIGLLFFMHGAKLSRQAILQGMGNWRLHAVVFASTFVLFPILGLCLRVLSPVVLSEDIYLGFLYLCVLPATVQSAIAFTSIAGGNVAAAVCSASASSILGVFLSPVLVGLLMTAQDGSADTLHAVRSILLQLMAPFLAGHFLRPLIGSFVDNHRKWINKTDRLSILLVVYTAFSEAVTEGIWSRVTGWSLLTILAVSCLLLAIVLAATTFAARRLGFSTPDEITIVFCGSKKSLANGIPMANVLFPASAVGMMVLPLMIFHQVQLMACAVLASRYAGRRGPDAVRPARAA